MHLLKLPCPVGQVSDGFHTFDELYDHRCTLFVALMSVMPAFAWFSKYHHDDTSLGMDWFIAGIDLPRGQITYHMPEKLWHMVASTRAKHLPKAPPWDGHTSEQVLHRLNCFIAGV